MLDILALAFSDWESNAYTSSKGKRPTMLLTKSLMSLAAVTMSNGGWPSNLFCHHRKGKLGIEIENQVPSLVFTDWGVHARFQHIVSVCSSPHCWCPRDLPNRLAAIKKSYSLTRTHDAWKISLRAWRRSLASNVIGHAGWKIPELFVLILLSLNHRLVLR